MGRELLRIDLKSGEVRPIYRIPDGFKNHIVSISADGKYAYTSVYENSPEKRRGNSLHDYYVSHPLSKIERIALDGSGSKTIFEENNFIAHVNASPKDPMKLTFCHEGDWRRVDHRLWTLDLATGNVNKLHECADGESIGHEYWFANGERVGYHGHKNGRAILGAVNFDGTDDVSFDFPFPTGHIFSFDQNLIVGDGSRDNAYMRLWRLGEDGYEQPRALCFHGSSSKNQDAHPHPRLTPDGKSVLYTSDVSGNNQIYLAEIPDDIEKLPFLSSLTK
jgi:oligogalacturonide lyase